MPPCWKILYLYLELSSSSLNLSPITVKVSKWFENIDLILSIETPPYSQLKKIVSKELKIGWWQKIPLTPPKLFF